MNNIDFQNYLLAVVQEKNDNPHLRLGQIYFNVLSALHSEIAEIYCGGSHDPFYSDSDIPDFLSSLYKNFVH